MNPDTKRFNFIRDMKVELEFIGDEWRATAWGKPFFGDSFFGDTPRQAVDSVIRECARLKR